MTNEQIKEIVARSEDEHEYLKDRVHDLYDENVKLKGEIERLHSIIKEVREYIKDIQNSMWHDDKEVLKTILEILDKEKE